MAAQWFVVRAGKEHGPFAASQLKELASKGSLLAEDLVRRSDMKSPVKASNLKGVFNDKSIPFVEAVPESQAKLQIWESPALIGVSMVFCFPIGLCLIWIHSKWSKPQKVAWTGACGVILVLLMMAGTAMRKADQKALAEADSLWKAGDRAAAVAKYRPIMRRLLDEEQSVVYGRVIDFDFEQGNAAAAKALLDEAFKANISPKANHPEAKTLVVAAQAEKAQKERQAKLSPTEKLKEANWNDVVHAQALHNQFDSNEVAALEKYKGKTIIVEGEVESVEAGGIVESDMLFLGSRNGSRAVKCSLSSGNSDELKKIRRGSWVRVQGKCTGKGSFTGVVDMTGCIFAIVNR